MENKTTNLSTSERRKIDFLTFYPSYIFLFALIAIGLLHLDTFKMVIDEMQRWLTTTWGWMSIFASILIVLFTFIVALSKLGDIRLGGADAKPEFSMWQWFSISLCAGIGIGILFWAIGEPIFHLMRPPLVLGVESGSREAGIFSVSQAILHWTIAQYCLYTICGVAFALVAFNMKRPLSIASALFGFVPKRHRWILSHTVHAICIFSLCGAVSSSMGSGLMQIGSGLQELTGIPSGKLIWAGIAITIISLYSISSITGLKKGMAFLSSLCTRCFFFLIIFMFIFGPTIFILEMGTEVFGYFINTFFRNSTLMSTMMPEDSWSDTWLVVFMAAFFAYAPPIGLFLARLGKGRTVRQFIFMNVFAPTMFCFVWITVFGSVAINFQWSGSFDVWQAVQANGLESTVFGIFKQLPFTTFIIGLFVFTTTISFATLADPMTAVLATISTKGLTIEEEAPIGLKLVWGVSTGVIAYLLVASGGIDGLRGMFSVGGFLMMFITCALCVAVVKEGIALRQKQSFIIDQSQEY